jgi:chaperonin GroEL (HSP60 family)
VRVVADTEVEL